MTKAFHNIDSKIMLKIILILNLQSNFKPKEYYMLKLVRIKSEWLF